ncbi:YybH family protein [Haloferax mediterranei]|nr:SgcJ/EcaC family oxidoreductase [Haloferax mediterranei]
MASAQAFRELDTTKLAQMYAEDADWTNAFGTTLHGRDAIVEYHEELFEDPHFSRGKILGEPDGSIRFVSDDVAVAKTFVERAGQESAEGDELPTRRNHSLKVLNRQDEKWVIVSEMYMDEDAKPTLDK